MNASTRMALFTLVTLTSMTPALAQGRFLFSNRFSGSVGAVVFDVDHTTPLAGPDYSVQAYVGTTQDSLAPVGSVLPFRTGGGAGFWTDTVVTVPDAPGGTRVYVEARAWEAAGGLSWESAKAAGKKFGQSNAIALDLLEPPATPNAMWGIMPFSLVPEPSTAALGAFGFGLLLVWGGMLPGDKRAAK